MKSTLPTGATAALEPVRDALIARARADARSLADDARDRAARAQAEARNQAAQILAASRQEGERQADAAVAAALVRRRREARKTILASRTELYDLLRRRCRSAARALRDEPDYPELLRRLTEHATAVLGPDTSVHESPDGGIVAVSGDRRIDLSLPTLTEWEIERLGPTVEELWST